MAYLRAKKAIGAIATPVFDAPLPQDAALRAPVRPERSAAIVGPQEAPPQANNDAYTTSDAGVVTGNLLTNDTPGDVPLQVTAVNGSALAVGREFILASGARLRVDADGSFTYNPNGAFNNKPTTNDVFSYTVAGGDTATVTMTIEDPLPPNTGTEGPDTLNGTPNDDVMNALGGNDIVNGFGGNDTIDGGTGADSMTGGTGNDTYKVDNAGDTITEVDGEGYDILITTVNFTLTPALSIEELVGAASGLTLTGDGRDNIIRGGGSNTLFGLGGNDLLQGGGSVTMWGGTGDDTFIVRDGDKINEADGEGYDVAYYTGNFLFFTNAYVELLAPLPNMVFTAGVQLRGNIHDNLMHGTAFNDVIDGQSGNDTMIGFAGDDRYIIDQAGDVAIEEANGGIDSIYTTLDAQLTDTDNLEHIISRSATGRSLGGNSANNEIWGSPGADLIVGAGGNDTVYAGDGNDSIYGDDGHDVMWGMSGADLMVGGAGSDLYNLDNVNDVVVEDVAEAGQNPFFGDRIVTGFSYTLAANQYIESITLHASSGTLTGNHIAQYLSASGGSQTLIGLGGDDHLNAGPGADTTDGGLGDDTHYVDNGGDIVIERAGEGRDIVYTSASYGLGGAAEIEILSPEVLSSTNPISLVGNSFGQVIYGNAGNNAIGGGGGTDVLLGLGGDDLYYIDTLGTTVIEQANEGRDIVYVSINYALNANAHIEVLSAGSLAGTDPLQLSGNELNQEVYGNAGANILRGGGGADLLLGGFGDDEYYITSGAETIFEYGNQGRDIIYTALSHTLAAGSHVEILSSISLSSTENLHFGGNELNNIIYGNAGANLFYGGGGVDTLVGGLGDDTYYILGGNEALYEGAGGGRDTAYAFVDYTLTGGAEIEILSTASIGGTGAINLTGNEFAQEVDGNNGINTIDGKGGSDLLVGYGGADTFAFTTALGASNVDWIADFVSNLDKMALDDAVFTGLAHGALPAGAFAAGSAAADADDRIIYNSATGQLFFDADGNGAGGAVQFASVATGTILAASDFTVI